MDNKKMTRTTSSLIILSICISSFSLFPNIIALFKPLDETISIFSLFYFFIGCLISIMSLAILLVVKTNLKKKLLTLVLPLFCLIFFFRVNGFFTNIHELTFLNSNSILLENISKKLLANEITIDEANETLKHNFTSMRISGCSDSKKVNFILYGITDNCYGFTYSLEELPQNNEAYFCCGEITNFNKIKENWYSWLTT